MAFATLGCFGVGYIELCAATAATFVIDDQHLMGTPNGIFGSIRSAGGVLATTIYLTILQNRMTTNTTKIIVPALIKAGLPVTSVKQFLLALNSGVTSAIMAVPGVTEAIVGAGVKATQDAYTDAFSKVFYTSIAFGACSLIAAFLLRPISEEELAGGIIYRLGHVHHHAHGAKGPAAVEEAQHNPDAPLD